MKIGQVHFLMYDKNGTFWHNFLWHPFLGNKTNLFCMYISMYVYIDVCIDVCIFYVLDSSWEIRVFLAKWKK